KEVQKKLHPESGTVKLGIYINTASNLVPLFINDFRRTHPDCEIDIVLDINYSWIEDMHEKLIRGNYDMIITSCGDNIQNCQSRQIAVQSVKLLVPLQHPLAGEEKVPLEKLKDLDILCVSPNSYMDVHIKRLFASKGIFPHISYSKDWTSLITETAIGKGVAFTTILPINSDLLTYVEIDEPNNKRDIFISWSTNRALSPSAKLLLSHILKVSEENGPNNLIF
ncbi:MAG: LysR family transcriptional regulator substrate-binding protein, partial [Oscillospiraceae bacterium]|nr:LysR family transcriptional regulator substrate-binding protein [Oscillospiraceae bacterium]